MPTPLVPQKPVALDLQSRSATSRPAHERHRASVELVRVEKNLVSLGFFTPPNKKVKDIKSKTVQFNRQLDGQKVEVKAVILPSAAYGLPMTSDQDKYLAFQKIVSEARKTQVEVRNPVGFSSA